MKLFLYVITVEGESAFPIDMLRYDRCTPHTEQDSASIGCHPDGETVRVDVAHQSRGPWSPTVARWESFGWRVRELRRMEINA